MGGLEGRAWADAGVLAVEARAEEGPGVGSTQGEEELGRAGLESAWGRGVRVTVGEEGSEAIRRVGLELAAAIIVAEREWGGRA